MGFDPKLFANSNAEEYCVEAPRSDLTHCEYRNLLDIARPHYIEYRNPATALIVKYLAVANGRFSSISLPRKIKYK
jgi:hypothetical protein